MTFIMGLAASVRIDGADHAELERLLRYCARPSRWSASSSSPTPARLSLPQAQPDERTELFARFKPSVTIRSEQKA